MSWNGSWWLTSFDVTVSVVSSTTFHVIVWAAALLGDSSAGSRMRSQLKATAAASNGVPSVNVRPGRSFRVHTLPSSDVKDSAMPGVISPVSKS